MQIRFPFLSFVLLSTLALLASAKANDWPTWRGPQGNGKLADNAEYPQEWSEKEGLLWKVPLSAPGNSSPIVSGKRLFLTMAENGGKARSLLCFDIEEGRELWKKTVPYGKQDPTHKTNPFCAASPTTDGEFVYAWHGNAGLWAYDLKGNEQWHQDLGSDYQHQWGANAGSPVIHNNSILLLTGPGTAARLVSLNKRTGETQWNKDLPEATSDSVKDYKGSWATPFLMENNGRTELLVGMPRYLRSFAPESGEELWRVGGLSDLCYSNVLVGKGSAVYLCGFGGPGIGVRLPAASDTGDLTQSHRLWADPPKGKNQNPQRIGSGQIVGDHLFLLNEPGVIQCLEVSTGKSVWRERLSKRKSWSSMNLVGGKLYVNDTSGTTFVMEPDPSGLKLLSTNSLGPGLHTNASLAFANGRIYLRTDSALFAIGK